MGTMTWSLGKPKGLFFKGTEPKGTVLSMGMPRETTGCKSISKNTNGHSTPIEQHRVQTDYMPYTVVKGVTEYTNCIHVT